MTTVRFRLPILAVAALALTATLGGCTAVPTPHASATSSRSSAATAAPRGARASAAPSSSVTPGAGGDNPGATPHAPDSAASASDPAAAPAVPAAPAATAAPDYQGISDQLVEAAGGTVVQLTDSSGNWTVVVASSSGSESQAVVDQTTERISAGPFQKSVTPTDQSRIAGLVAALRVSVAGAAAVASAKGGAACSSLVLGGSGSSPRWHVVLTNGSTISVDGISGVATT